MQYKYVSELGGKRTILTIANLGKDAQTDDHRQGLMQQENMEVVQAHSREPRTYFQEGEHQQAEDCHMPG